MPISHILLALLVITIWGVNFIFIDFAVTEISPLLLCGIRFFLAFFPAIFFVKPPSRDQFKMIFAYGCITFGLQFSLLFYGMHLGMPPGLSSLLLQIQVFFSILFATLFLGESPNIFQILGGIISFTGIAVVALHFDKTTSLAGFILIICASAAWGAGNFITKKMNQINMPTLIVWGSFFASFPLFIATFLIEGPNSIVQSYHQITWISIISIAYIVYLSTWVGYGVWNWLVARYPIAAIAPFTLLVPVIGMLSAVLVTRESFQTWKFYASLLVIGGLSLNLLGTRLLNRFSR